MRIPTSGRPAVTESGTVAERGSKQSEGAGPEGGHELARGLGDACDQAVEHAILLNRAGDVDNDRVPGGALLGGKDAGHGGGVEGIRAQPVDGFGGQGDEAAGAEDFGGAGDGLAGLCGVEMGGVHSQAEGLHISILAGEGSIVAGYGGQSHLPYTHWLRWLSRRKSKFG